MRVLLLVAAFCLCAVTGFGQQPNFQVTVLDSRNGLSNSSVNQLFQDSDNLLWVATWDGLNLYDGKGFNVFNYTISDQKQTSIGNNIIEDITEDANRNIWISTVEGVSKFNKSKAAFSNYFYAANRGNPATDRQYRFLLDEKKNLYCMSAKHGLLRYQASIDSFIAVPVPLPVKKIRKALFNQAGYLCVLDDAGRLSYFRKQNNQFVKLAATDALPLFEGIFQTAQTTYAVDKAHRLYECSADGRVANLLASLPGPVTNLILYRNHYLFANKEQGYLVLDSQFQPSRFLEKEWGFLKNMPINTIQTTNDGALWCGTDGNGVIVVEEKFTPFHLVSNQSIGFTNNKQIRGFLEVNNELWVATKGNGILVFKRNSPDHTWNYSRLIATGNKELAGSQAVYSLGEISNEYVLIGNDGPGFLIYDKQLKRYYPWDEIAKPADFPALSSVYRIRQLKDGTIWLGTSGYGLFQLSIKREKAGPHIQSFKQYKFTGDSKGPANNIIYDVLELDDQHLALACRHGGLSIFNRSQQSFTQLVTKSRKEGDISNNDILSLHLDRKSRLWVGTSFGLNSIPLQKLKSDKSGFTVYTEKEGLPNNTVHGISEDTNGNIWISTNKGLVRLDPEKGTLLKMDDKDGLQSNEFSDGSVWKNSSGEMYFGGVYGFNYGNPDTIRINTLQPNLLISNFRLGTGQQQENGFWTISPSGQSSFRELESERDEDFFELQLRAIDYRNADKCEFAYRLEGLDNDWRYAGGNGTISYSNLSPGNYSLLVKWSNGESGWTNPVKALSLRVNPHWLLTLPAFLVYYLIAAIAIYIIYTNRKERLRIRQQLALEQQLRSHQDALYQERINFFTNIAHELQTPLTLVNGSLERMDQQGDAELTNKGGNRYLSLVRQQASRLTYLVQQLMEFRKGEDGKTSSNQDFIDVSKLVPAILNLFIEAYPGKSLQVKTTIEPGISGYADIDKLEKILYNLLSNAFKHGGNGEMLEVILQRKENQVSIRISNSGVNMEQGDAEKLFELFFTQSSSRHSGFSTGIGLAFTRQLTTAMGGTIDVESREGWLHFSVLLPLNQLNLSIAPGTKAINQPSPLLQAVLENTEPLSFAPATGNNKVSLLDAAILNDQKEVLLLVEDDSEIRFFLKEFLTAYYTVFEAENGKAALAWLANNSCDLIISDIMMPEMSGLEFCEQVKQNPVTCHLPVILLTARSSQDQKNEGYEAGADAYIPKPFQLQHLLVRIKSLLDTRRRMKEAVQSNVFSLPQDGTYLDEDKQLLSSLVRFVEENMENTELEAADLERFANLSKMQLYRKLKTLASMSPGEFIRTIRLQKAAHMLQHTSLTVNEIFYQTGFNNQSYFFREFKKQFGQSPGEYREKFRISV